MQEIKPNSVSETIRDSVSISEAAEKMGFSRPTFYKFLKMYEAGDRDEIPGHVLKFFELASQDGVSRDLLESYMDEINRDRSIYDSAKKRESRSTDDSRIVIKELEARISNASRTLLEIHRSIEQLEMMYQSNPDLSASLTSIMKDLKTKELKATKELDELQCKRATIIRNKSIYAAKKSGITWNDGDVKSLCLGAQNKTMVIFESPESPDMMTIVEVYIRIGSDAVMIAEYSPDRGKRFVTIDDLVPSTLYQYKVVQKGSTGTVDSGLHALVYTGYDTGTTIQ